MDISTQVLIFVGLVAFLAGGILLFRFIARKLVNAAENKYADIKNKMKPPTEVSLSDKYKNLDY